MAGNQTDNLMLLDLTTGLPRTSETGGTPDIIQSSVDWQLISGANMLIDGDLTVNGTTTTIHSEQVNIRDNHLYLNADYTAVVAQTGGLVINVLPTATADVVAAAGFTAGVAAVSNPTVITTGAGTFAAGDIIQVAGANLQANDGIYEVLSHVGTTLTIKGIGVTGTTVPWVVNDFTTDATGGGDIRIVNVNVIQGDSSGNWQTSTVSTTTGITYNDFTIQGVVDLQVAYVAGNTITTSGGEGNVIIAGTETLAITTTGGVDLNSPFDFDSTSFDVQMTGSNGFSIDGTAASNVTVTAGLLALSTLTSGSVEIDGVDGVAINSTSGPLALGDDATTGAINIGTGAAARTITMGNATGATSVNLDSGTGAFTFDSTVGEAAALMTMTTSGAGGNSVGMFVGSSNPDTVVTGLAGSLFLRDTGSGGEVYVNSSTGSGTSWTLLSTAAGTTLQTAYEAGNTITTSGAEGDVTINGTEDFIVGGSVDVNFDTTGSISFDADLASNFTVDGGNLTFSTTTSGNILVDAADNATGSGGTLTLNSGSSAGSNGAGGTLLVDAGDGNGTGAGGAAIINGGDSGAGATGDGGAISLTAGSALSTDGNGAEIFLTSGDGTGTGSSGDITLVLGDAAGTGTQSRMRVSGPNDEDEALLQLTTTGTNGDSVEMFVGDSDPSGSVTGLAGSLFFRDTGTGAELYLNTSTGSGTTWTALSTGGSVTLQNAYINGNTITTSGAEGDVTFTGTEDFVVTLSDMLVDTTASISLDADAASNFTVDAGTLTLSTTTSGNVAVSAADAVTLTAGNEAAAAGNVVTIDAGDGGGANDGGAVTLTGGESGAGATGNGGNVNLTAGGALSTDGDGGTIALTVGANTGTGVQGFVDISGVNLEGEALVQLTTTGVGGDSVQFFVGDSDPNTVVTGLAGSLFMRDTATGGILYVNESTGSGTVWSAVATAANGVLTLQNAYIGGNTIVTSGGEGPFDVSGTETISLDSTSASNFTTTGATLTLSTVTSGTVDITSAADIAMTFATNTAAAMVIDDGTNNFINFDSTTSDLAVEVNQFLDLTTVGAGITLTAGTTIAIGDVLSLDTAGDAILADSNTGTDTFAYVIGIALTAATATNPVRVLSVAGDLVPVAFSAAPGAAANGSIVFISSTAGRATLTAPTGGGNVVYKIGILQGGDGADTTPTVIYQPQFLAKRP